jgi:uncharacterized protein with HEPN domain
MAATKSPLMRLGHAVRGIGNILRHEYERVEAAVRWRVVTESLPKLATVIDRTIRGLKK